METLPNGVCVQRMRARELTCDACKRGVPVFVRMGEPLAHESCTADLCAECLTAALDALRAATATAPVATRLEPARSLLELGPSPLELAHRPLPPKPFLAYDNDGNELRAGDLVVPVAGNGLNLFDKMPYIVSAHDVGNGQDVILLHRDGTLVDVGHDHPPNVPAHIEARMLVKVTTSEGV